MHLEAANLTNTTTDFFKKLDEWDKDLDKIELLIAEKKEKGEPTGGLEINLLKSNQRYIATMNLFDAATAYIKALEKKVNELEDTKTEFKTLKKYVAEVEKTLRFRVCDLPLPKDDF